MSAARGLAPTAALIGLLLAIGAAAGCGKSTNSGGDEYVALGDSYVAAAGVPDPQPDDGGCQQSTNNYPKLVARKLGVTSFTDRSCAGATTSAMTHSQFPGITPQLDALTAKTRLVTLGVGANDFEFSALMMVRCPAAKALDPSGSPCREATTKDGKNAYVEALPKIRKRVVKILKEIRERSPHARILVVGYPQAISATATCAAHDVTPDDAQFTHDLLEGINDALRAAARSQKARYVDVWKVSAGHELCSADPWVNGPTTNKRAVAFHPFAVEQRAVAKQVEKALHGTMPPAS